MAKKNKWYHILKIKIEETDKLIKIKMILWKEKKNKGSEKENKSIA